MPCPSSGCLVMTKRVRQHKIVKGGKLQKSESSLICVVIAEGSTNDLPVSISILAHFCIPVSLRNKNVLLRCLSVMLRNPYLAEAVSLTALFAIRTCFILIAEENMTYRLYNYVSMQTQQKEKSKRKGNNVSKETRTNYNVPSRCVFAIRSF